MVVPHRGNRRGKKQLYPTQPLSSKNLYACPGCADARARSKSFVSTKHALVMHRVRGCKRWWCNWIYASVERRLTTATLSHGCSESCTLNIQPRLAEKKPRRLTTHPQSFSRVAGANFTILETATEDKWWLSRFLNKYLNM